MPCLNEEMSIAQCIEKAQKALAVVGVKGEVVVADNMSSDGSPDIATSLGARVVYEPKRGYGRAYLKGFQEARGRYIVMADSDGTYDFSLIPALLEPLKQGYDLVIGSRTKGDIEIGAMPWLHRYVGVQVLTYMLNMACGAWVSDAHSGMRAFTSITTTVQGGMCGEARSAARRLAWERLARSLLSCVSSSHRSNSAGPNRSLGSNSRTTR